LKLPKGILNKGVKAFPYSEGETYQQMV